MDITIRNVDPAAYRALKARAAGAGQPVGALVSEAIRQYLSARSRRRRRPGLAGIPMEDWGPGDERVSEEVDAVLYSEGSSS